MKKFILVLSLVITMLNLQAQNYLISFAGSGESTTVDNVTVENLTQCTSVNLAGGDTLSLDLTLGLFDLDEDKTKDLIIYPNPMTETSNIEFDLPVSGYVSIQIYDLTGKNILQTGNNLAKGIHSYQICGLSNGIYLIHINSESFSYTGKLISKYNGAENPGINYHRYSNSIGLKFAEARGTNSFIQMQYNTGDIIKFVGTSGSYQTIFMAVPANSQTITFDFVECTDGDGNNYSVVQIGSQLWMAENLNTTKYRDGTSIPKVTDPSTWHSLTTGAYCDYNNTNNLDTINTYGHLYNWHAATDARNIAPAGWHVPTDAEWTTLIEYLGGANVAAEKIVETCSIYGFNTQTNTTNESGFTVLPAGVRWGIGDYYDIGDGAIWWSSTENGTTFAWNWSLDESTIFRLYGYKTAGTSLRCVKD